jgi:transposase
MDNMIGIDVSKETLDVNHLADGQHKQFLNGKTGLAQLIKWMRIQSDPRVIFEATGAYHRLLERTLGNQSVPFVKVNPKQARRFAQASGKLAKTDWSCHGLVLVSFEQCLL